MKIILLQSSKECGLFLFVYKVIKMVRLKLKTLYLGWQLKSQFTSFISSLPSQSLPYIHFTQVSTRFRQSFYREFGETFLDSPFRDSSLTSKSCHCLNLSSGSKFQKCHRFSVSVLAASHGRKFP